MSKPFIMPFHLSSHTWFRRQLSNHLNPYSSQSSIPSFIHTTVPIPGLMPVFIAAYPSSYSTLLIRLYSRFHITSNTNFYRTCKPGSTHYIINLIIPMTGFMLIVVLCASSYPRFHTSSDPSVPIKDLCQPSQSFLLVWFHHNSDLTSIWPLMVSYLTYKL